MLNWSRKKFNLPVLNYNTPNFRFIRLPISEYTDYNYNPLILPVQIGSSFINDAQQINNKYLNFRTISFDIGVIFCPDQKNYRKIKWEKLKNAFVVFLKRTTGRQDCKSDRSLALIFSLKDIYKFKHLPIIENLDKKCVTLRKSIDFREKLVYSKSYKPYTYFIVYKNQILNPLQICKSCSRFLDFYLTDSCRFYTKSCIYDLESLEDPDYSFLKEKQFIKPINFFNFIYYKNIKDGHFYNLATILSDQDRSIQNTRTKEKNKKAQATLRLRKYFCSRCDFFADGEYYCRAKLNVGTCGGPFKFLNKHWKETIRELFYPWEIHILSLFGTKLDNNLANKYLPQFKRQLKTASPIITIPVSDPSCATNCVIYENTEKSSDYVCLRIKSSLALIPYKKFCKWFDFKCAKKYYFEAFKKRVGPYPKENENKILNTILNLLRYEIDNPTYFRRLKKFFYKSQFNYLQDYLIQCYNPHALFTHMTKSISYEERKHKQQLVARIELDSKFKPTDKDFEFKSI